MAEKQVMVAMSEGLRNWLREEADRIERAYESGHYASPHYNPTPANPTRPHVSLACVIEMMLEQRRAHRQRRRRAKKAARERKWAEEDAPAVPQLPRVGDSA